MNMFIAFTKKELLESWRTYKLIVMLAVFILFGIMNPLFAKMLPELLNGTTIEGIPINLPESVAMDSWGQFFKNIGQMGMLVLIIVFSGIMSNEFGKGTLINVLTKGMKRSIVIMSKLTGACLIWTLSYLVCFVITFVYTNTLWESNVMNNAFFAFLCPWAFGLLLIALLIFGGVLFKTFYGSLLVCGGTIATLLLISVIPSIDKYNPVSLAGSTLLVLNAQKAPEYFVPALIICFAATFVLVTASIQIFNKKQL